MKHGYSNTPTYPVLTTTENKQTKQNSLARIRHFTYKRLIFLLTPNLAAAPSRLHWDVLPGSSGISFTNILISWSLWLIFNVCKGKRSNTVPSLLSNHTTHQVTKDGNRGYARPMGPVSFQEDIPAECSCQRGSGGTVSAASTPRTALFHSNNKNYKKKEHTGRVKSYT